MKYVARGFQQFYTFLSNDLPNKILIIKDHLQRYITEHNLKHFKQLLVHELKQYIDKKNWQCFERFACSRVHEHHCLSFNDEKN